MGSLRVYHNDAHSNYSQSSLSVNDFTLRPPTPGNNGSRRPSSSTSILAAGSYRNEEEIKGMKSNIMVQWLNKQQCLKLWATGEPEEGVVLKRGKGDYICCPEDLRSVKGGLFEQVVQMNVACALTVTTKAISIFMAKQPGRAAILQGNLSIQILPDMTHLSACMMHQFAAFIRDRQMLVVWGDEPNKIIADAERIQSILMLTVWNNGENYGDNDEKLSTFSEWNEPAEDTETGSGKEPPRRPQLLSPFIVCGTLLLIIGSLGLGWRKLAIEVSVDGNYIRLALAVVSPLIFFVGLFTMQTITSCLCQILGPISQMTINTSAYSGQPPPQIISGPFPHITIQMPVYKEGLNAVIRPTVMSIKAAISTYELQGGSANIFVNDDGMQLISEEEAARRQDFYEEHNIGWVARPKHNCPKNPAADFDKRTVFNRKGKFKKASNMNYALMVSCRVEEKLSHVSRHPAWNKAMETEVYEQCFEEVLEDLKGQAWAGGNIRIGDYILIIDSDTRVPNDCLLESASEMELSPEIAIMQFSSGVMKVSNSFFESGITFFTNLIYTAIRYAVASGDVCPFVGHNAILRWSALQQITYTDEDGYEKFWSESHVSEDFDMALRLQCEGYKLRLAAYHGDGFKEGVSLTVYDELARWEKYAYGCNELLFHPIRYWIFRGPFTPLFRKFIASNMPFHAKVTIMAYICTYYAIGSAWILTVMNYFVMGWYAGYVDQYYLDSFSVYFSTIIVFTGVGNVALAILRYRTGEKGLAASLWENFKWVPLLMIFLGGISMHISQALLSHLFGIDMSWGATTKEIEETDFFQELPKLLKKFRFTFVFCFAMIGLMVAGAFFFPPLWRINQLVAIYPLATVCVGHLMLPIVLNPALMMFTF